MKTFLVLLGCMFSFSAAAEELFSAPQISYETYSKPENVSDLAAKNYMKEKNRFIIGGGFLRSGNMLHDFIIDIGERFDFLKEPPMIAGVANVKNAAKIDELFFVNEKTPVRFSPAKVNPRDCGLAFKKCDGHVVGYFPEEHLIYASIEYNGFVLATDGEYAAWIDVKKLVPFDYEKIYLKNEASNFEQEIMKVECAQRNVCPETQQ